jgi:hypothetical protein
MKFDEVRNIIDRSVRENVEYHVWNNLICNIAIDVPRTNTVGRDDVDYNTRCNVWNNVRIGVRSVVVRTLLAYDDRTPQLPF